MESATSPHLFIKADEKDIKFIDSSLEKNKYVMFIRKVSPEFPDHILRHYIYEQNKDNDDKLILIEPNIFTYNRIKIYLYIYSPYMMGLLFAYFMYLYLF